MLTRSMPTLPHHTSSFNGAPISGTVQTVSIRDGTPRVWAVVFAFLVFAFLVGLPPLARAATPDEQISAQTKKIVEEDIANANFGEARKKLRGLGDRCKRGECSPQTMGQIHVALGMV